MYYYFKMAAKRKATTDESEQPKKRQKKVYLVTSTSASGGDTGCRTNDYTPLMVTEDETQACRTAVAEMQSKMFSTSGYPTKTGGWYQPSDLEEFFKENGVDGFFDDNGDDDDGDVLSDLEKEIENHALLKKLNTAVALLDLPALKERYKRLSIYHFDRRDEEEGNGDEYLVYVHKMKLGSTANEDVLVPEAKEDE